jgi:signal transduction histidine kinase
LDNAQRHGEPEHIWLQAEARTSKIVITLRDDGVGIEKEHLRHLFERFYRVDKSRSRGTGGSGLGLSICYAIAATHNGQIRVESEIGRGTTVIVELPS